MRETLDQNNNDYHQEAQILVNSSLGTLSLVLQTKQKKPHNSSSTAVVNSVSDGAVASDPSAVSSLHHAGLKSLNSKLPGLQPSPEYIALQLARQRKISDSLSSLQDTSDEVRHCCQKLLFLSFAILALV